MTFYLRVRQLLESSTAVAQRQIWVQVIQFYSCSVNSPACGLDNVTDWETAKDYVVENVIAAWWWYAVTAASTNNDTCEGAHPRCVIRSGSLSCDEPYHCWAIELIIMNCIEICFSIIATTYSSNKITL